MSEVQWKRTGRRRQKGDESGWEKEEKQGKEKVKEGGLWVHEASAHTSSHLHPVGPRAQRCRLLGLPSSAHDVGYTLCIESILGISQLQAEFSPFSFSFPFLEDFLWRVVRARAPARRAGGFKLGFCISPALTGLVHHPRLLSKDYASP